MPDPEGISHGILGRSPCGAGAPQALYSIPDAEELSHGISPSSSA
ncbi:MAG: hypothetical protein RRY40_03975 [Oscillospiraceae bacterium]